jgi:hypothetical protein
MKYGDLPRNLGLFDVQCEEMMFVQYMPIKLAYESCPNWDKQFDCFNDIIAATVANFIDTFGDEAWEETYIYLTAKHMYQVPNSSFNRHGYHSDGFMTSDINYIWSDKFPTIFNTTNFILSQDDRMSIGEMEEQAKKENEITFPDKSLVRLNQFNIHKVGDNSIGGMRTFVKVSFSKDKYDLIGNAHNYKLKYDWEMKERKVERNIPQSIIHDEVFKQKHEWFPMGKITTQMVLNESLELEPINSLKTLETFEEEYRINDKVYKIVYKVKSGEKPSVEQLMPL